MTERSFDIDEAVVIKDDNLFLVSEADGRLPLEGDHPLGLYYNDCRFLSGWELEVMGAHPRALVVDASAGSCVLHELTNRGLTVDHGRLPPPQTLQLRLERELKRGCILDERITLDYFDAEPVDARLRIRLRGGFEPLMWIRGMAPEFKPKRPRREARPDGIAFRVSGRDGVERSLSARARPLPARTTTTSVEWDLRLERGRSQTLALRYAVSDGELGGADPGPPPLRKRARRAPAGESSPTTSVTSDDQLVNRVLARSMGDLRMLRSRFERDSYYSAGTPWYATVFGRDSLITAMQMLAYDPGMARATLRLLGRKLGRELNDERDEEPGKVLHELRVGELANLGLLPFARYYGSVDSTALFLCLMCDYTDWAGDLALFHELSEEVDAALGWLDESADLDGDGLIEYARRNPAGLLNQGWKDSRDGVVDERGRSLDLPIALVEVQGYAMRAKRRLARIYDAAGEGQRADRLRADAAEIGTSIERFWLNREGFYSMALDGEKRASRALASNQGHLLWSLAIPPERAALARDALMSPAMFCGWGVRTLAASESAYNPLGYHTGSVWPHDSALTAHGLRKYGFDQDFTRIFEGLLDAASRFPDYRLPELFAGFSRDQYERPVPYPVACRPQAWAAGAIPYLLTAGLGLVPDGLTKTLQVIRPSLPRWLERVEVRGLRIAGATVNLDFERARDRVTMADVDIRGDVEVVFEGR